MINANRTNLIKSLDFLDTNYPNGQNLGDLTETLPFNGSIKSHNGRFKESVLKKNGTSGVGKKNTHLTSITEKQQQKALIL